MCLRPKGQKFIVHGNANKGAELLQRLPRIESVEYMRGFMINWFLRKDSNSTIIYLISLKKSCDTHHMHQKF